MLFLASAIVPAITHVIDTIAVINLTTLFFRKTKIRKIKDFLHVASYC
jgi:hypothetical protein